MIQGGVEQGEERWQTIGRIGAPTVDLHVQRIAGMSKENRSDLFVLLSSLAVSERERTR